MNINIENLLGIKVILNKNCQSSTPNGYEYYAKGFYIHERNIIIVGKLNSNKEEINTIKLKYKREEILSIKLI